VKNLISVLIILAGFLVSCKKSDSRLNERDALSLKIKAGYMCGWGSGEDSLYISSTTINYVYYVPANSNLPKIKKTRPTTDAEWNSIVNSINPDYFLKLNYNSCNICVDGCDEWISIQNDQMSHQIRFGLGGKIDSLDRLQNILAQLRSEFNR
jgi:hypothetical protein